MNLKKLIVFLVLSLFCIPTGFVFAANPNDLEIDEGKNLLFDFRETDPYRDNTWYHKYNVYDNVNIGAGTRVVLDSDWEYVHKNTVVDTSDPDPETGAITQTTTDTYAQEENLATLSIKSSGQLILNSGSELSLRNQYNLITSPDNVSIQYRKKFNSEDIEIGSANLNFDMFDYPTKEKIYENRQTTGRANLFLGEIVFENGDTDTKLTFEGVSSKTSEDHILPTARESTTTYNEATGSSTTYVYVVKDVGAPTLENKNNIVSIQNNLIVNSNRAVINVNFNGNKEGEEWDPTCGHVALGKKGGTSYLSGDGTIVKQGVGVLYLQDDNIENIHVDGSGLTGANTGYSWRIEEGTIRVSTQSSLGTKGKIYIASGGSLSLDGYNSLNPSTAITDISNGQLTANVYSSSITSSGGGISIVSCSVVELKGDIDTAEGNDNLNFSMYRNSALVLSGTNNAKNFHINFGGEKGGESNYLVTDVDGLASNSISVVNTTKDELKEFAFFEVALKEDSDKTYSGSLNGEMYLHKLGTGTVTLSGNNTYTKGTYITEGGLLLATSNSIGTGKIMFDNDSETYASIGVSSQTTTGDINLTNNIHVKKGAILDVAKGQNMYLKGDLVRYDARPGYEAEFVKNGLGNAIIAEAEGVDRKINISTFTITEGGFILDKGVASDSYFSLDGQQAFLEVRENAAVKDNDIKINNGDLRIFNEKCISSATAVNFYNEYTSTDSFSKFHIMSDAVLSSETIDADITIAKNIEFVVGSTKTANTDELNTEDSSPVTVTAEMSKFKFGINDPVIPVIVKSGDGKFVADGNGDFALDSLYVNGGEFRIENTTMTASGEILMDKGGIFSVSQTSHFAYEESVADKQITVLDGGIGIYNKDSIDQNIAFVFLGTDSANLSRLIIESSGVVLQNNISVKAGIEIQNDDDFSFVGESITFDEHYTGILAKSGEGTMTIASDKPGAIFEMGEIRALGGNLLIKSDIDVGSITIEGENAWLSIEDNNGRQTNAKISNNLSMASGGNLLVSTSTLDLADLRMISGNIINNNATINADVIDCSDALVDLIKDTSVINAKAINLRNSIVQGFGNLNANVNVRDASKVYVGSDGETEETLKARNVAFDAGSTLYIDIDTENNKTDILDINGDITVQKNVTLHVNIVGNNENVNGVSNINFADDDSGGVKEFEFITFTGSYSFENTTNKIFDTIDINLGDPKFSVSTALRGNSIFLAIAQKFDLYNIPGATKNQEEMIDTFNKIASDDVTAISMEAILATLNQYYSTYVDTGDKTQFLNALQDLSGIFYANSFMASTMFSKASIIYNRLNDYSERREAVNRVWAQVYTTNFTVAENEENPKFENNMYGLIAGYDTIKEDNLVFGIAGFYGQGELKQMDDKADVIDAGVNAYGDYKINDSIDVKGLIGYSMQDYDTTRTLRFNKQKITSKYTTNTISLDVEAGYKYDFNDRVSIRPIVGANCAVVSNGDIEEDGDTEQRLKIAKDTYSKAEARIGVGLQSRAVSPFNWYVSTAIKQILAGDKFTTKSRFMNAQDYEFEIESTKVAGTSFSGGLGCAYDINSNLNISLDLSVDAGAVSQFGGNIGASYKW